MRASSSSAEMGGYTDSEAVRFNSLLLFCQHRTNNILVHTYLWEHHPWEVYTLPNAHVHVDNVHCKYCRYICTNQIYCPQQWYHSKVPTVDLPIHLRESKPTHHNYNKAKYVSSVDYQPSSQASTHLLWF